MAVHYTCDECGKSVRKNRKTSYRNKEYAMVLDIGKTQLASMYGTGVCGSVELCNECIITVVKGLLNGK